MKTTTNAKHTPGPWNYQMGIIHGEWKRPDDACATKPTVVRHNGLGFQGECETHMNALLIAAAPDLLNALKWFVADFEARQNREPSPDGAADAWDDARAAIAKALGREG